MRVTQILSKRNMMLNRKLRCGAALLLCSFVAFSLPLIVYAQSTATPNSTLRPGVALQSAKEKEIERKLRLWSWWLSQLTKREKAALFLDVPLDSNPPIMDYD